MKTTREGKRFILATLLIVVASFNTGNNLIYLVLALMLSFIFLSWAILRLNLSRLSLSIRMEGPAFAGQRSVLSVTLKNGKRLFSTSSVRVILPDSVSTVYFAAVPKAGEATSEAAIVFSKRGIYRAREFFAESGFPFIFFASRIPVAAEGEALVYPALTDIGRIMPEAAGQEAGDAGRISAGGEELFSLRDFRYGDDWRRVHWKASAKREGLLVKEYAEHEFRKATVLVGSLGPVDEALFEKVVTLAATAAKYYIDAGYQVRLMSARKVIPFGCGTEHLYKIFDILAVIGPDPSWESPGVPDDGYLVAALASPDSAAVPFASAADMVLYASAL